MPRSSSAAAGARRPPSWLWGGGLLLVWLAAFWTAQRMPPMQSPDEHSHVARAYLLCEGEWRLKTPPGQSSGGAVDRQLGELMHPYLRVARDASLRLSVDETRALEALRWSGDEAFLPIPGTGYYLPVVYLPQAVGLCLGRALGWTVMASYELARTLAWTLSLLWIAAATRLHAPGPLAWLVLAVPMSLFQWLSPTVDGLAHALTLWAACAFLHLQHRERHEGRALALGWVVALAVLAGARPYLLALFALPAVLAWRRRDLALALAAALALLAVLAWYGWAAADVVDRRVVRSAGLADIAAHYARQPGALLAVVHATLADGETLWFYAQSFVGILGWLDTLLPLWAYPALGAALAATAALSVLRGSAGLGAPWLMLVALASVPLVFAAMLVSWSAFPAARIEGVQGRYFIAPALLLAVAWAGPAAPPRAPWRRAAGRLAITTAAAGAAVGVTAFWLTLGARYH
jgi:uncharacterized membrane protein